MKLKNPFAKKKSKEKVTDEQLESARQLIDSILYPKITKDLKILNDFLKDKKIQIGMDITWIFQKIE